MGSSTKASFTPFVDPRVYQTSPTDEDEEDDESSATGKRAGPRVLQIGFLPVQPRDETHQLSLHHLFLMPSLWIKILENVLLGGTPEANYFLPRTWLFFFLFLEETQRYPGMLGKATPQRSPNTQHFSQKQFLGIMLCSKQCGTEHSIHACWAVLSSRRALPLQIWLTERMALLLCLLQVTNHWSQLL